MPNPNEVTPASFDVREVPNDIEWKALQDGWNFAKARGAVPFSQVSLPKLEAVFSPEKPVLCCHKEAYYSIRRELANRSEWFWRGYAAACVVLHRKLLLNIGYCFRNIYCKDSAINHSEAYKRGIRERAHKGGTVK